MVELIRENNSAGGSYLILVLSTFKVANGMEAEVREAFLNRPHLVDTVTGFLGMEVLSTHSDNSIFHLLTRWTDKASFEAWHSGPLHKASHIGIPKGLKLDASHTVIQVLEVLPGNEEQKAPPSTACPRHIFRSRSIHWLAVSGEGLIIEANPAFELLFQEPAGSLAGQPIWGRLTQPDSETVRVILKSGAPEEETPILLNFLDRKQHPHTLECYIERHSEVFHLRGEPLVDQNQALSMELLELNNQWSLLVRENGRNVKALKQAKAELEKALADLDQSHWHLRRIQETLPICMYCGQVKTGEEQWQSVVDYLKNNSLFLSHGCCPACLPKMYGGE